MKSVMINSIPINILLSADFTEGKLFWLPRSGETLTQAGVKFIPSRLKTWNRRYAGQEAFTAMDGSGYLMGRIFNAGSKAHRVLWALRYNSWPVNQIDHINGNRTDNKLSNLRDVTQSENNKNSAARSDNTSGHVGVCFDKSRGLWMARINRETIGRFNLIEDAIEARRQHKDADNFTQRHGA